MPVACEKAKDKIVPSIPSKTVDSKKSRSRSRSTSRPRSTSSARSNSRTRKTSRSRQTSRRPKSNSSLNLSLSDLFTRNFGPSADEEDHVEVQYYFWGAELSCSAPTHKWQLFQEEEECEDDMRHLLFLRQATLGVNAIEGERNIVQVTAKDFQGKTVSQILCSLTLGRGLDAADLDLTLQYDHEVSFKLIKGSGPIHLVGNHYVETPPADAEVEELNETDTGDDVEDLDDMKDEDEKDLKEGADEEYETEEDDKTKDSDKTEKAEKKTEEVEAMED